MGDEDIVYSTDNEHIKSISMSGKIVHKYLYEHTGKIVEENCLYYFNRYIYDENERLVKIESAWDRRMYSSTYTAPRTEFMTSQNSTADTYRLYMYDRDGNLSKIENYFNETGNGFEHRSTQTFEYEGLLIAKVTLYSHAPVQATGFTVYTYDKHGNVVNEKYFSNLSYENELISETSYKYDNYKNPFQIFSMSGSPGMYTNVNNIIETSSTRHYEVPGFDKYQTEKRSYEYNKNGYPVKEITEDGKWEYKY